MRGEMELALVWITTTLTLICHQAFVSSGQQYVPSEKCGWNKYHCSLAVPEVEFNEHGKMNAHVSPAVNEDLWIGLYKTQLTFTYIGCGSFSQLNGSKHDGSDIDQIYYDRAYIVKSLGDCRLATGCQTVGIQKHTQDIKCICVKNEGFNANLNCNKLCSTDGVKYPCGDVGTNFSVYTMENKRCIMCAMEGNCLLFKYDSSTGMRAYEWNSCVKSSSFPKIICGNTSFTDQYLTAVPSTKNVETWSRSAETCILQRQYPASLKSIEKGKYNDTFNQLHWTGIIRLMSIVTLKDTNNIKKIDNCPSTKQMLSGNCTSTTGLFTSSTIRDVPHNINTETSKGVPAQTAVGVSVSVILVLMAVVIILKVLHKRGLFPISQQRKHNKDQVFTTSPGISMAVLEATSNKQQNVMPTDHCYFVLESSKPVDMTSQNQITDIDCNPEEYQYNYIEDTDNCNRSYNGTLEEYDTAKITQTGKQNKDELEQSFNVYNKLVQDASGENNDEYDHVNATTLSTFEKTNIDNRYHCTEAEIGENAYNHLSPQMLDRNMTDNTYNVTESSTREGDYNIVENSGNASAIKSTFSNNYDKVALQHLD
ncbi:uncharacterized protein LOC128234732 isoform X2 [Mya arenaria]|uniref:uncharacterized protein LOC128234732 isoform X2 n=1 Tax=Mya arenaria TaxID=6604 RepID=UPI0022E78E0B|nr:uncharacterized protein LOC128234732 isoform X2 [Mya arenaria]